MKKMRGKKICYRSKKFFYICCLDVFDGGVGKTLKIKVEYLQYCIRTMSYTFDVYEKISEDKEPVMFAFAKRQCRGRVFSGSFCLSKVIHEIINKQNG